MNKCDAGCNDGEYPSILNNKCAVCNTACSTCSNYSTCVTCHSVNGIAYYLEGVICTVNCPFGKLL